MAAGIAALVGKAGESLVAAELMRRGVNVAFPAYDGGIDLLAYHELNFSRMVPIQVKARSESCYHFNRSWFRIPGMVLVQVWYVIETPQFYLFRNLEDIEAALGLHAQANEWAVNGRWTAVTPAIGDIERMQPHRNRWERITEYL